MSVCITIKELSEQLRIDPEVLRAYAQRSEDPLPARMLPGKQRGQFVIVSDFEDWARRNAPTIGAR